MAVAAAIGAVELRPFASKGEHWRTEPEDALQVSEEHLDLLSLTAGESSRAVVGSSSKQIEWPRSCSTG
jgi:hypothetical protein